MKINLTVEIRWNRHFLIYVVFENYLMSACSLDRIKQNLFIDLNDASTFWKSPVCLATVVTNRFNEVIDQ
jgi:hypothetical protein